MSDNKLQKFSNMVSKLGEYILFIATSSIIIYFVFKFVFGTPIQQKNNHDNIVQILNQVDTIKAMESFNMDGIYSIKDTLNSITNSINELNKTVENQTREIVNMKKVVNQKIETANRIITLDKKPDVEKTNINSNKNQKLDSFFRAKYNNINKQN